MKWEIHKGYVTNDMDNIRTRLCLKTWYTFKVARFKWENHDNHQLFGYWYPISRHTIRSGCFFSHVIGIAVTSDRFGYV